MRKPRAPLLMMAIARGGSDHRARNKEGDASLQCVKRLASCACSYVVGDSRARESTTSALSHSAARSISGSPTALMTTRPLTSTCSLGTADVGQLRITPETGIIWRTRAIRVSSFSMRLTDALLVFARASQRENLGEREKQGSAQYSQLTALCPSPWGYMR